MTSESAHDATAGFVDLQALLASVSDEAMLADPALTALVVEYSCWQLHWDDWCTRQPSKRHIAFKEWVVEGRELFDRRDELKGVACALLRHGDETSEEST